jgi:hypothetical protein
MSANNAQPLQLPLAKVEISGHSTAAAKEYDSRFVPGSKGSIPNRFGIPGDLDHYVGSQSSERSGILVCVEHAAHAARLRYPQALGGCRYCDHLATGLLR